jgi:hypothetical protein
VLAQDVIYVGGGNTANLLAVWRAHGLDRILARAWQEGVVMCGISAGMNCWFEQSVTDSFGQALQGLNDGLERHEVVASRPAARGYRVEPAGDGGVRETVLPTRYLGAGTES